MNKRFPVGVNIRNQEKPSPIHTITTLKKINRIELLSDREVDALLADDEKVGA